MKIKLQICLIIVLMLSTVVAAQTNQVTIGNYVAGPGDNITAELLVLNASNVSAAGLTVTYNQSVVVAMAASARDLNTFFAANLNNANNGSITINAALIGVQGGLSGTVRVANVTLRAVAPGTSFLNISDLLTDDSGSTISSTISNGSFTVKDITPPASITNLQNTTGNFWINWGWNNPPDLDFNYTMVFINGSFVTNTSTNFYISLYPHAIRTISTRTVDTSGNINATWVNQTTQIADNPPVLAHIGNKVIDENQTLTIEMNATDLDSDILTYYHNRTDLFSDFNTATGKGNWTPSFGQAGIYHVNFLVSDGFGGDVSETIQITVNNVNRPPSISSVSSDKTTVVINETFDVTVTASDPDVGDTLLYQFDWENNGTWSPNQSSDTASHSYSAVGSHTINARVWDNHGASATNNSLVIAVSTDNTPPDVFNPLANPGEILLEESGNIDYAHMSTMLNVTATDDSNVSMVTINLSSIGGSANAVMTKIGDDVYSITTNATGIPGLKSLSVNATDIFGNSNISITVPLKVTRNGDINGNGLVNIGDVVLLGNNITFPGNPAYVLPSSLAADVTGDGHINIGDVVRLGNFITFPGDTNYLLK
jgi:hypothetical protein